MDELVSISKSYDHKSEHYSESRLVITTSSIPWKKIASRATFVRVAGNLAGSYADFSDLHLPRSDTFACRVVSLSSKQIDTSRTEREFGSLVKRKTGSRVSLARPSLTVYLLVTDSASYVGYADILEQKRPSKPIKHPTELHWKIGRCMVNLSSLKEGDSLCDPFCGTGTILLEAESMGIYSTGIDFDPKMCEITRKNLAANGFKSTVFNSTYEHTAKIAGEADALVTDVPYGTASRSTAAPKKLIQDFISTVPSKMKLTVVYKKGTEADCLADAKKYEIYRHKSLTRVIAVR